PAACEQDGRRIEYFPQGFRVACVAERNQHGAAFPQFLLLRRSVVETAPGSNGRSHCRRQSRRFELAGRGAKNRLRTAKTLEQLPGPASAQAWHHAERKPM